MKRDNAYFDKLLRFALQKEGTCKALGQKLNTKSGPTVQMWKRKGVAHWARIPMDELYGEEFRKELQQRG